MEKEILSLCKAYKDYFPIGAAVTVEDLQGVHGEILKEHFNSLTAENVMKFAEIHPLEDKYDFEKTDKIKDFAIQNNMKLRGHTFVWHNQVPDWVFTDKNGQPASSELLLQRLKEHMEVLCKRYNDVVYAWDVVNEAIEDKSEKLLRDTRWLHIIGEDYIEKTFKLAKEVTGSAALYYNDYNNEFPEKLEKSFKFLKALKEKETPIDGVGIQAHWNIRDKSLLDNLRRAIESYSSLGLKIQVTELDISMFEFDDKTRDFKEPSEEMLYLQEKMYDDIFSMFREYKNDVTGVTLWGISDKYTWKDGFPVRGRKDWPLLFDVNGKPKSSLKKITSFMD